MKRQLEPWQIELAQTIDRQRAQGWGWRWDGVESWSTEKIFAQLHEIGIDSDAERFAGQAAAAGRFRALENQWVAQIPDEMKRIGLFWEDFPLISVRVLWERLAPHVICADLIEAQLNRALRAKEKGKPLPDVDGFPADLLAAVSLARYLQGFAVKDRRSEYNKVNEGRYFDYTDWVIELIESHGPDYPDAASQIADVMSDCCEAMRFQTEAAMALAVAGRRDEAISRTCAIVERFPNDIWALTLSGDVYEQLDDHEQAIALWLQALPMADDSWDWEGVTERLEPALCNAGRGHEAAHILKTHLKPTKPLRASPAPSAPPPSYFAGPDPMIDSPAPLMRAGKVGRNDPCPCGSGKKYKKCCLRIPSTDIEQLK